MGHDFLERIEEVLGAAIERDGLGIASLGCALYLSSLISSAIGSDERYQHVAALADQIGRLTIMAASELPGGELRRPAIDRAMDVMAMLQQQST